MLFQGIFSYLSDALSESAVNHVIDGSNLNE